VSLAPAPDDAVATGTAIAPPPATTVSQGATPGVWDVRSGAAGRARNGELYADW
jgi:hypothetical protein